MARLGGGDDCEKRRNELAERLDLDLDRRLGALSKGNRQKVGVVYAFQHEPDLLILDEPTIGLDPLVSQIVLDIIREASKSGATVMLSSHDLGEVAAVCERAAILREGRLVELAPISQIVHKGERRLKVWFTEGSEVPALPAELLAGVRVIEQDADSLHIAYHGTAEDVLKWLAEFPVDRIATPQTSLQDAFMQYYRKEAGE
jgi:ABC-2 type transport system ATP-binding protein